MTEQLTDEERAGVERFCGHYGAICLRVIDAHATELAALVAQLEAAEQSLRNNVERGNGYRDAYETSKARVQVLEQSLHEVQQAHTNANGNLRLLEARAAELTRERDEARDDVSAAHQAHANAVNAKQAEVTRLQSALDGARVATAETRRRLDAAEARVRDLTEQRDSTLALCEARVRELDAQLSKMQSAPADMLERAIAAEQERNKLADANLNIKADHAQRILELESEQLKALRERDAFESRIRRAENLLSANSSYWASEVLCALRGQET